MLWIIGIIGLIVILWPAIGGGIAWLFNGIAVIVSLPFYWILRMFRNPKNKEDDERLTKISTAISLFVVIVGLFIILIFNSIS